VSDDNPDWSRIPRHLQFIIQPAQRYGQIQFDEQIEEFEATAPEAQKDELQQLARRLWDERDAADGHALVAWVTGQELAKHPEAARVEFLMVLLNRLGYC
jgi:hypothetical protein